MADWVSQPPRRGDRDGEVEWEISFYEDILKRHPSHVDALKALGNLYTSNEMYSQGLRIDQRLAAIDTALRRGPVPPALATYVRHLRQLVTRESGAVSVVRDQLALVQPLCEAYARSHGREALTMFRLGTWLVNMRLSAAAGDAAVLRQPHKVRYFLRELRGLDAPPAVL